MKIQELRIGNWFIGYNGKPFQWSLEHFEILTLEKNRADIDEVIKSPIQLTEEILLKCGFTRKGSFFGMGFLDTIYWYNLENQILYIEYTDSPFVEDEGTRYPISSPIKHLHTLMNVIYNLTGNELKYNVVDVTSSNYDKQMLIEMVREEAKTLSIVLDVDLNSRSRQSETLDKRQVIIWKLFKHHNSYTRIGKALGFSHVSVRNAVLKVEDLLSVNDANMVKLANIISDL